MTATVTSLDELRQVTHAPVSQSLFHGSAPTLRFPEATAAELSDWQRRLNRDLHACGCTSGAIALFVALGALAIVQFAVGLGGGSGVRTAVLWVAVAFAAALGGKSAGLLRARVRRRRLFSEIDRTLAARGHPSI